MKLGEKKNQKKDLSAMFNFPTQNTETDKEEPVKEQVEVKKTYNPLGEDLELKLIETISGKINR